MFRGAIGLCLTVGFFGCSTDGQDAEMPKAPKAILVAVQEAKRAPIRDWIEISGTTAPRRRLSVVSQGEGVLVAFPFREGDPVSKGDVLARIDPAKIQADVQELEARTEFARLDLERTEALIASEGAPQEQLDKARTEYRTWMAKRAKAQATLEDATIRASFSGIVSTRFVEAGDVVSPKTKLMELLEAEPEAPRFIALHFKAFVPERRIGAIHAEQRADITLDAYPGKTFSGRLARIYPEVDPKTRSVAAEITLRNPDGGLRPGLSGIAQIIIREKKDAVLVPSESLLTRPDGREVCFVVAGGRAEARPVKRGIESAGLVEIVEGLSGGEQVIVLGQHRLKEGAPVQVQRSLEKSRKKKEEATP
jgi:membrane fusion protein (multidrug efflux system)